MKELTIEEIKKRTKSAEGFIYGKMEASRLPAESTAAEFNEAWGRDKKTIDNIINELQQLI